MATDKVATGWRFPARSSEETDITGRCRREITKSPLAGGGGGGYFGRRRKGVSRLL